jgi:hypothetical protein
MATRKATATTRANAKADPCGMTTRRVTATRRANAKADPPASRKDDN